MASPSDASMIKDGQVALQYNNGTAYDTEGGENNVSQEAGNKRKSSGVLNVVISGLALFSDGYNAQISMSTHLVIQTSLQLNGKTKQKS